MRDAEVDVDAALVRALLRDQAPALAGLDLAEVASGWDNVIFRLGDDLCARLPRRSLAAPLVEHEQRWLPRLAPRLPLPVPVPVVAGRPGAGYPWAWSVCRWLPGEVALDTPPADLPAAARTLGAFVAALHVPADPDAPPNPYRGVPLDSRDARFREAVATLETLVDVDAAVDLWDRLVVTPPWPGPPLWLHGDLHPGNVLVAGGVVGAVIDDDTWARARAWALALGVAIVAGSGGEPRYTRLGREAVAAALAGP